MRVNKNNLISNCMLYVLLGCWTDWKFAQYVMLNITLIDICYIWMLFKWLENSASGAFGFVFPTQRKPYDDTKCTFSKLKNRGCQKGWGKRERERSDSVTPHQTQCLIGRRACMFGKGSAVTLHMDSIPLN